ncbi:twitching motility protein PilT [Rossellomorea vietnamensis]|uniref:Twitching motility protein PilT n=2 Tax=Rossellomorea vietnamensis TaxID=218284 RepID=A0A0P6VUS8_9BACI|nr:twitching motility protein PilT [Rossellomorea vietnamensis]
MGYQDVVEFISQLIDDDRVMIMTSLVEMEIMSFWEIEIDPTIKANRERYIEMADEMYDVSKSEMHLAAKIRRKARADIQQQKSIKAPDAIIAASAFIHNATLVSNNDKDFTWIRDHFTYNNRKLDYVSPIQDKQDYADFNKAFVESRRN